MLQVPKPRLEGLCHLAPVTLCPKQVCPNKDWGCTSFLIFLYEFLTLFIKKSSLQIGFRNSTVNSCLTCPGFTVVNLLLSLPALLSQRAHTHTHKRARSPWVCYTVTLTHLRVSCQCHFLVVFESVLQLTAAKISSWHNWRVVYISFYWLAADKLWCLFTAGKRNEYL